MLVGFLPCSSGPAAISEQDSNSSQKAVSQSQPGARVPSPAQLLASTLSGGQADLLLHVSVHAPFIHEAPGSGP